MSSTRSIVFGATADTKAVAAATIFGHVMPGGPGTGFRSKRV